MATSWSSTSQLKSEVTGPAGPLEKNAMAAKSSPPDVMDLGSYWEVQKNSILAKWMERHPTLGAGRSDSIRKLADKALLESHEANRRTSGGRYNIGMVYQSFLRDFTQLYYDRRAVRRSQQGSEASQRVGGPSGGRRGIESANSSAAKEAASGSLPLPRTTTSTTRSLPEGQAATSEGQSQRISALKSCHGDVTSPSKAVVSIEGCRRGVEPPSVKATSRTPPTETNDVANETPLPRDSGAAGRGSSRSTMEETMDSSMGTNNCGPQDAAEHSTAVQSPAERMGCVAPPSAHRGPGIVVTASGATREAPSSACVPEDTQRVVRGVEKRRAAAVTVEIGEHGALARHAEVAEPIVGSETRSRAIPYRDGKKAQMGGIDHAHCREARLGRAGRANFVLKPRGSEVNRSQTANLVSRPWMAFSTPSQAHEMDGVPSKTTPARSKARRYPLPGHAGPIPSGHASAHSAPIEGVYARPSGAGGKRIAARIAHGSRDEGARQRTLITPAESRCRPKSLRTCRTFDDYVSVHRNRCARLMAPGESFSPTMISILWHGWNVMGYASDADAQNLVDHNYVDSPTMNHSDDDSSVHSVDDTVADENLTHDPEPDCDEQEVPPTSHDCHTVSASRSPSPTPSAVCVSASRSSTLSVTVVSVYDYSETLPASANVEYLACMRQLVVREPSDEEASGDDSPSEGAKDAPENLTYDVRTYRCEEDCGDFRYYTEDLERVSINSEDLQYEPISGSDYGYDHSPRSDQEEEGSSVNDYDTENEESVVYNDADTQYENEESVVYNDADSQYENEEGVYNDADTQYEPDAGSCSDNPEPDMGSASDDSYPDDDDQW
ncbi:hypothetical protein LshimejAT787_0904270 [Lyophyllum shimeji]|uniref:Uncharacterized protein n=1 Tax=Lyophyllum shimeji TaxID=47721 RepID=A0A9P3PR68_LYOSH|nr:hypothetical protein LshimejAT787_0904270 [Lyophyllum shimeji]